MTSEMQSKARLGRVVRALFAILAIAAAWGSGMALCVSRPSAATADGPRAGTMNVLFVGNSYTRFNDLPRMVRQIATTVPGGPTIRTEREAHGGFSLRVHWMHGRVRRLLRENDYDAVIIQGHSRRMLEDPSELRHYAARLHEQARGSGSRVVLFSTWARREGSIYYRSGPVRDPRQMQSRIDSVYYNLARELDAEVAPVGRAWLRASEQLPQTHLHGRDGAHPAVPGTYLSALVIYATLTGRSPTQSSYVPYPVTRRQAPRMRSIAASVVSAHRAWARLPRPADSLSAPH